MELTVFASIGSALFAALVTSIAYSIAFSGRMSKVEATLDFMSKQFIELKTSITNIPNVCQRHEYVEQRVGSLEGRIADGLEHRVTVLEAKLKVEGK